MWINECADDKSDEAEIKKELSDLKKKKNKDRLKIVKNRKIENRKRVLSVVKPDVDLSQWFDWELLRILVHTNWYVKNNSPLRRKIFMVIKKELSNRGVMIQKEYVLSVPLEIEVDKTRIVDLISLELENNELSVWMIRFLLSRLRICKSKTANVRELVYNGGRVNRDGRFMSKETWDKCDVGCRCNVYDLPKVDWHVCCKGSEVKDVQLHGILAI